MNAPARIGPNAVLQHLPVLDAVIGRDGRRALLHLAEVPEPPSDAGMLPEDQVARLHRFVRLYLADRAPEIQRAAGLATGDYILAHRIPKVAHWAIRNLPAPLGARLLSGAVAKHAWTFAGSGAFRIVQGAPLAFEIRRNPLADESARAPVCAWHSAVFERLFATLVWPHVAVQETACRACGDLACRFELHPRGQQ